MPTSPTPRAQRKKAASARLRTFLFSDLRDYTSFVEAKGDAAAARLLRDYRTLVRREIARHEGAEVKTEGDSFYVVFESPSAAIECAVALMRAADVRNGKDPTAQLRIGVGLHAGETVAYDDQFVGSAVNIASRLAGKAGADELLISDTLRGLVRTSTSLPMTERGPLELKGVSEPVRAWSVGWRPARRAPVAPPPPQIAAPARRPTASGQFLCPVVVGRAMETATFERRLSQAADASGGTVLLAGEAGLGKSAFVREATDLAAARAFRILTGLTHQSDTGLPYAPFVSAVRSGFRGLERDELGRMLRRSAPDLADLFPELGRLSRAEPTGIERHRLAVAFQHLFHAFAHEAPVLLVLEDLHWADAASLELVQHLAREAHDARILVLGTYRSDEMHRRHPLLRAIAELQRERLVTEIHLKKLTPDETREVIRATFAQSDPNVTVGDEFRDAIYTRSEGNPFFTEELLKALVESGGIYFDAESGWERKPIAELGIPGSIREAVRARVEQLSPDARQTLAAASVIGHQFSFDVLRVVRGADETVLEGQVREFIEQQLVSEVTGGEDYAFRHALTREVVYDDLLVRERKRLHRTTAEVLAAAAFAEPALLAHHLLAAGEDARAAPVLVEAGDRALRAGAPRDAVAHYARAIEIGLPDGVLPGVVERQAEAYFLFDTALSIKAAEEALGLYRQSGDRRGQSRVSRLEGRGLFYEGRNDLAEQKTEAAITVLGDEECLELGRAIAQLATLHMTRWAMAEAVPLAERAIQLGERFSDAWTQANALITRGSALPGEIGLPDQRRGLEIALANGLHEVVGRGYNNINLALISGGASAAERRELLTRALAYGQSHGLEHGTLSFLRFHLAFLRWGGGEWDEALATTDQIHEASSLSQQKLYLRIWIDSARTGPVAAASHLELLARRSQTDVIAEIARKVALADGLVLMDQADEAQAELVQVAAVLDRYGGEPAALERPPFMIGGPVLPEVLSAAIDLGSAAWADRAEAEIRPVKMAESNRQLVSAARALLASNADDCARHLMGAYAMYEHVGFAATWHRFAIRCVRAATRRKLVLGPAWTDVAARTRPFAERVGARWWLEVLAEAGL
jgi:class 3 adenylate cyclase